MIRPFRALVHYNQEIRAKFAQLKEKFGDDALQVQEDTNEAKVSENQDKPAESQETPSTGQDKPTDKEYTSSLTAYQHLGCLIDFMDNTIQAKMDYLSGTQPRTISFNHLWYLFKPGDDVVGQGRRQAYRVISITSTGHKVTPPWRNWKRDESEPAASITLFCVYIDFDGKQLGPVSKSFVISKFDGEKAITALEVYPIRFAEDDYSVTKDDPKAGFQQELIDRGKMFIDVASVKHMHYNGFTLEARDEVDSQVMVDFAEAFAATQANGWQPEIESLIGKDLGGSGSSEDETCSAACCAGEYVYNDNYVDKTRNENYIARLMPGPDEPNDEPSVAIYPRPLKEITATKGTLTNDDLIIMSYRVFGFVLRSRKWAKLDLKYLSPVSEGSKEQTAFDQLVLPKQHKDIVYCLVDQHFRNKEARVSDNEEVDIIRGKGKGLILLLHGSPGVGKTTTAEGVAERFNKPLFQITCGDLGATASEVEAALERNFSLANRWGCILLLDEADVFLAQRSPKNFVRNGLVAVFLRVLEYYAGILFLTTNRIGDFDEAFTSRIHISLYYPPLDKSSTREIFRLNLRIIKQRFRDKGREIDIHEKDILKYATAYWKKHENMRWNGRQIRNACQTALAMAEFDAQNRSISSTNVGEEGKKKKQGVRDEDAKVELTHLHVQIVSDAYLEFMRYLKSIYGFSADEVAKNMRLRA
ncbi:P-loop containing nucleoside triphosphate hydrolase protein, partial [Trichoderma reesei RUT C-30]